MPTHRGPLVVVALLVLRCAVASPALAVEESPSALQRAPDGWKDLLESAGPGLKGWTRLPLPPGSKTSDTTQWKLESTTGLLVCRGDGGHEWLRWDEELGDSVFHVEWRFTPVPGKKGYNSGVYARNSADGTVWHQAQTGDASGGYLFGNTPVDGQAKRLNLSRQLHGQRVKPAGEWNTYEITSRGKSITLWVNGAVTSVFEACEVPRGFLGLEAEGWRIEFRNVKLKVLER